MAKKNKNNTFYIIGFIILLIILIAVAYFVLHKKNNKATSSSSGNPTCYKTGPLFSCTKANLNAQPKCTNNPNNNIPYNKDTRCCNGTNIYTVGNPLRFDLFCNKIELDPLILNINVLKSFIGTNYFIDISKLDPDQKNIISVDWGDGSDVTTNFKHQYSTPGTYQIKIYGNLNSLDFKDFIQGGDVFNILQIGIEYFGSSYNTLKSINFNFNISPDLTNIPLSLPPNVTQLSFAKLNILCDITKLDVSHITDMSYIFRDCKNFNQDISKWDISRVPRMSGMFSGCTNFNQPLNNWDVSSVTDMSFMFLNCTNFNQPLDNWNVSTVKDMTNMFSGCTNFNQDISKWDVSNVYNMSGMFNRCTNFNQPLDNWNVYKVIDMSNMFASCKNFNQSLCSWITKVNNKQLLLQDGYLEHQLKICGEST